MCYFTFEQYQSCRQSQGHHQKKLWQVYKYPTYIETIPCDDLEYRETSEPMACWECVEEVQTGAPFRLRALPDMQNEHEYEFIDMAWIFLFHYESSVQSEPHETWLRMIDLDNDVARAKSVIVLGEFGMCYKL